MRSVLVFVFIWAFAASLPAQTQRRFAPFPFLAPTSYVGLGIADIDVDKAESIGLIEPHGVEVMNVANESPAQRAGLEPGDVVLTYRGTRVEGLEHFARLVQETPVGRKVELGIHRDGTARTIPVTIGERSRNLLTRVQIPPAPPNPPYLQFKQFNLRSLDMPRPRMVVQSGVLGAELEAIDGQFATFFGVSRGVLVRTVQAGSPADKSDVQAGDVIVSIDGKPVGRTREVSQAVQTSRSGKVSIEVMRDGKKRMIEVVQATPGRPGMTRRVTAPRC